MVQVPTTFYDCRQGIQYILKPLREKIIEAMRITETLESLGKDSFFEELSHRVGLCPVFLMTRHPCRFR